MRFYTSSLQTSEITSLSTGANLSTILSDNYQLERWKDNTNYYTTNTKFITYTDGNVGIGTSNPITKLHVGTGNYATGTQNLRYFNYATAETAGSTSFTDTCAVFDSSIWVKSFIGSSSDERIKKNIHDIHDDDALEKILSIQPKKYTYIDPDRGTSNIYGFIAQQIKEVIPEAVKVQTDVVPNIFTVAKCNGNILTFDAPELVTSNLQINMQSSNIIVITAYTSNLILMEETSNVIIYTSNTEDPYETSNITVITGYTSNIYLSEDTSNIDLGMIETSNIVIERSKIPPDFFNNIHLYEQVEIINTYGYRDAYIITGINPTAASITVNKNIDSDKVFVYGTQVNDFHTLDKSYIYTLNVCATQKLSEKVDTLTSQIQELYAIINHLQSTTSNIS